MGIDVLLFVNGIHKLVRQRQRRQRGKGKGKGKEDEGRYRYLGLLPGYKFLIAKLLLAVTYYYINERFYFYMFSLSL